MTFDRVIASLAIPDDARVDRRVPKKLLVEQGAPTAADKRQIQDGIEEMSWIAALKPTNIAVPAFRDDVREYLEIAVLAADASLQRETDSPSRINSSRYSVSTCAPSSARGSRILLPCAQTLVPGREGEGRD